MKDSKKFQDAFFVELNLVEALRAESNREFQVKKFRLTLLKLLDSQPQYMSVET